MKYVKEDEYNQAKTYFDNNQDCNSCTVSSLPPVRTFRVRTNDNESFPRCYQTHLDCTSCSLNSHLEQKSLLDRGSTTRCHSKPCTYRLRTRCKRLNIFDPNSKRWDIASSLHHVHWTVHVDRFAPQRKFSNNPQ